MHLIHAGEGAQATRIVVVAVDTEHGQANVYVFIHKVHLGTTGWLTKIDYGIRKKLDGDGIITQHVFSEQIRASDHRTPAGFVFVKKISTEEEHVNLEASDLPLIQDERRLFESINLFLHGNRKDLFEGVERIIFLDRMLLSVAQVDVGCQENPHGIGIASGRHLDNV